MKRLLYFLSNTDRELIARCGDGSKTHQQVKGLLVLLTGLLAFVSVGLGMDMMFGVWSVVTGVVCGLMFIFFDRSIISATKKRAHLLTLPLALFAGIIVSIPLELRLFDSRIQAELAKEQQELVAPQLAEKNGRIAELQAEIDEAREKLEDLQRELIAEFEGVHSSNSQRTGRPGAGPAYQSRLKVYEDYKEQTERRIAQLSAEIDQIRGDKRYAMTSASTSGDFLSRYVALEKIKETSPEAAKAVWGIRVLFVLILITPHLILLLEDKTEYGTLVAALRNRRREAQHLQAMEQEAVRRTARAINSRIPVPSFGQGFASAIDWAGLLAPSVEDLRGGDRSPDEADAAALAGDWKVVGSDLKKVVDKHEAKST